MTYRKEDDHEQRVGQREPVNSFLGRTRKIKVPARGVDDGGLLKVDIISVVDDIIGIDSLLDEGKESDHT